METYTVALGTDSPAKITYLKKVLGRIKVKAKIVPIATGSGVSDQPITSAETKRGSLNRSKRALETAQKADFAIGIEVGYQKNRSGQYEILCWVTAADKELTVSQLSHSFPLPDFHQKFLKAGKFLGDHVRAYHEENDHQIKKYLGEMVRNRETFLEVAIEHALLKYFMEKLKI